MAAFELDDPEWVAALHTLQAFLNGACGPHGYVIVLFERDTDEARANYLTNSTGEGVAIILEKMAETIRANPPKPATPPQETVN